MKTLLTLSILLASLVLTGCASQQLSLLEHGEQFAPVLGAEAFELRLLSYCQFRTVENSKFKGSNDTWYPCSERYSFLSDDRCIEPFKLQIEVPIREMEGISKLPSQFQLKHKGHVMVLQLNKASSKKLTQEKYETVYQLLAQNEVPEIAAVKEYRIRNYSSWRSVSSSNASGRYGGISRIGNGGTNNRNVYGTPDTPITNPN